MPSKSRAQHNAMLAAKHGHSTLGIPKKVGEEFIRSDVKASKFSKGRVSTQKRRGSGRRGA